MVEQDHNVQKNVQENVRGIYRDNIQDGGDIMQGEAIVQGGDENRTQYNNSQQTNTQEPIPYVTADMAWEMSKRAAAEAREEAIKESQYRIQSAQSNIGTQSQISTSDNMMYKDGDRGGDRGGSIDRGGDRGGSIDRERYRDGDRGGYRDKGGYDDDYDDRRSRKRRRRDDDEEEEDLVGFSPKLVKQLQTTVGVFNTLKDFASNPMQKAIEDRIGGLAAGIIENAFTSPRGPPPKRDMVDTILNSQMAFGLGQGLGSRAPELVESLSKSFGREKAETMIEGMIGKYTGGGGQRGAEHVESDRVPGPRQSRQSPELPKSEDQSNIELLLSLDPNNPEHVTAYAESQGGVSIDVARKMLMIHQDDIIKRMKSQGTDTAILETQRGSRIGHGNPAAHGITNDQDIISVSSKSEPKHNVRKKDIDRVDDIDSSNVQMPPPVQMSSQSNLHTDINANEDAMQYSDNDNVDMFQDSRQPSQEYVEYRNLPKSDKYDDNKYDKDTKTDNQQSEMMKTFAEDIGKVMGDVIGKIENLNNTVFSLQSELNEVKRQRYDQGLQKSQESQESSITKETFGNFETDEKTKMDGVGIGGARSFFPDDSDRDVEDTTQGREDIQKILEDRKKLEDENTKIQDATGFFPEKVQNVHDFDKELEEETKRAMQLIRQREDEQQKEYIREDKQGQQKDVQEDKQGQQKGVQQEYVEQKNIKDADNKSIDTEIIKKPIMSIVKKKSRYVPHQDSQSNINNNVDNNTNT